MDKTVLANRFDGYSRIFASDHPIGIDLKAMADTLRKMPEEKFAKIVDAGYEEDAFMQTPSAPAPGAQFQGIGKVPTSTPGGIKSVYPGMKGEQGKMNAERATSVGQKVGIPSDKMQKFLSEYEKADSAEVAAAGAPAADPWSKYAADAVAQNLVRDVLGMNKSICCDTGRHITKEQTMDGKKAPELKNVRPTSEDTGRALTPEQVPDIGEKLESDIYKKSKGAVVDVTKKLATTTEETPDAKAAEPQEVKKEEKDAKEVDPKETAKKVEEMEKEKAKAEAKSKSRPDKEATEVEATSLVAEGIEFDNVMQDQIDISSPEIQKLSSLFE